MPLGGSAPFLSGTLFGMDQMRTLFQSADFYHYLKPPLVMDVQNI